MSELRRFAIQRDDGRWYAGRAPDGTARWVDVRSEAHILTSYTEAYETQQDLQRDGFNARLYGLD
jgi:hypothetical protein